MKNNLVKKVLGLAMSLALMLTAFAAVGIGNTTEALAKCNHSSTQKVYKSCNSSCHYCIVKCKKCGKTLKSTKEKHFAYKVTYSKYDYNKHKYVSRCKCGNQKSGKEAHYIVNKKCTKCGLRK